VTFDTPEASDRFAVGRADLAEVGSNRRFGSDLGGFHLKVKQETGERNFNLAPQTKDKAESKLILDLMSAYLR
jgi:hypothetical protein